MREKKPKLNACALSHSSHSESHPFIRLSIPLVPLITSVPSFLCLCSVDSILCVQFVSSFHFKHSSFPFCPSHLIRSIRSTPSVLSAPLRLFYPLHSVCSIRSAPFRSVPFRPSGRRHGASPAAAAMWVSSGRAWHLASRARGLLSSCERALAVGLAPSRQRQGFVSGLTRTGLPPPPPSGASRLRFVEFEGGAADAAAVRSLNNVG